MQSFSVKKGLLNEVIRLPSSKSYANRALILASTQKKEIKLSGLPVASDVTILMDCLQQLGIKFHIDQDEVSVLNSFPECETVDKELNVGEGGTTGRFLAALLLLGSRRYTLRLGARLKERPWQGFIDQVNSLGAEASLSEDKLILKGPLNFPAMLEVDCSKTTQFATAFQLVAPSHVKIVPLNLKSSQSYWRMTEKMMTEMEKGNYAVPLDWSSASYPLAFAALKQQINFPGLKLDEYQADSKFLNILKSFQCVVESDEGIQISPGKLAGDVNFDVSDALDLVPALAFFLGHIKGRHTLKGIENLIHKESDRLSEVIKLLAKFNRSSSVQDHNLIINGHHEVMASPVDLDLPDDHRMVMTGTLFLLYHNGGKIRPAEAVNKSYPSFFEIISLQSRMN